MQRDRNEQNATRSFCEINNGQACIVSHCRALIQIDGIVLPGSDIFIQVNVFYVTCVLAFITYCNDGDVHLQLSIPICRAKHERVTNVLYYRRYVRHITESDFSPAFLRPAYAYNGAQRREYTAGKLRSRRRHPHPLTAAAKVQGVLYNRTFTSHPTKRTGTPSSPARARYTKFPVTFQAPAQKNASYTG